MAKTAAEWQALVDKVEAEIENILEHGQSISHTGGDTHTRADLDSLLKWHVYYQRQVDKLADTGTGRRVAEFV